MWEALAGNLAFSGLQLPSPLLELMDRSAWIDLRPDTNADERFKDTKLLIISEVSRELNLRGWFPTYSSMSWRYCYGKISLQGVLS